MPDLTLPDIPESAIRKWAHSVTVPGALNSAARRWLRDSEPPERETYKLTVATSNGELRFDGPSAVRARDIRKGDRIDGSTVQLAEVDARNHVLIRVAFEDRKVVFYPSGTLVLLGS